MARGGTGKSTLTNILLYLLGEGSIAIGLKTLLGNFGVANVVNKKIFTRK